ncbi:hypothetical protein [Streptomyces variabilis]
MSDLERAEPESVGPDTVNAQRLPDQECPECATAALAVITVTGHLAGQERTLGGWAWCQRCGATPHPTLTEDAVADSEAARG